MRCHGGGAAVTGIARCIIGCAFSGTECVNRCLCSCPSRDPASTFFYFPRTQRCTEERAE